MSLTIQHMHSLPDLLEASTNYKLTQLALHPSPTHCFHRRILLLNFLRRLHHKDTRRHIQLPLGEWQFLAEDALVPRNIDDVEQCVDAYVNIVNTRRELEALEAMGATRKRRASREVAGELARSIVGAAKKKESTTQKKPSRKSYSKSNVDYTMPPSPSPSYPPPMPPPPPPPPPSNPAPSLPNDSEILAQIAENLSPRSQPRVLSVHTPARPTHVSPPSARSPKTSSKSSDLSRPESPKVSPPTSISRSSCAKTKPSLSPSKAMSTLSLEWAPEDIAFLAATLHQFNGDEVTRPLQPKMSSKCAKHANPSPRIKSVSPDPLSSFLDYLDSKALPPLPPSSPYYSPPPSPPLSEASKTPPRVDLKLMFSDPLDLDFLPLKTIEPFKLPDQDDQGLFLRMDLSHPPYWFDSDPPTPPQPEQKSRKPRERKSVANHHQYYEGAGHGTDFNTGRSTPKADDMKERWLEVRGLVQFGSGIASPAAIARLAADGKEITPLRPPGRMEKAQRKGTSVAHKVKSEFSRFVRF
ncbi:uncharacterized protein VTP21DRAFT_10361 [Calcarisporiella thermophila]|uniref:uncharacterized protein n=1 Tax=Calcarisporiella thermophila TaxID=911321 RepID=UPI003742F348